MPTNGDDIGYRRAYFADCLNVIAKIPDLKSIAFPFRVGCGLAGGDWEGCYLPMLWEFSERLKDKTQVVIYRREGDE